jgi:hypothetical protein
MAVSLQTIKDFMNRQGFVEEPDCCAGDSLLQIPLCRGRARAQEMES